MATPAKSAKREDKLPLERALRALEDVHASLKQFAKQPSVTENAALNALLKNTRHRTKKLRKMATELALLWDHTFEDKS